MLSLNFILGQLQRVIKRLDAFVARSNKKINTINQDIALAIQDRNKVETDLSRAERVRERLSELLS